MNAQKFLELHEDLLKADVCFHHSMERIETLRSQKNLGFDFVPPQKENGHYLDEVMPATLTPQVFQSEEVEELRTLASAWGKFFLLAEEVFRKALDGNWDPLVLELIGTDLEKQKFQVSAGYSHPLPIARLDMIKNGSWKVCDINSSRPAGIGWSQAASDVLMNHLNPGNPFHFFQTMQQVVKGSYRQWCQNFHKQERENPFIAVIAQEHQGTIPTYRLLARLFREAGENAQLIFDTNLEFKNSRLADRESGQEVDIIIRGIKPDLGLGGKLISETYPETCCVIPPLYRRQLGHKAWMFLVRKFRSHFENEMGDLFLPFISSIPETNLLRGNEVEMPDGSKCSVKDFPRKQWSIKASTGSSGKGVHIGESYTNVKWEELLAQLAREPGT